MSSDDAHAARLQRYAASASDLARFLTEFGTDRDLPLAETLQRSSATDYAASRALRDGLCPAAYVGEQ